MHRVVSQAAQLTSSLEQYSSSKHGTIPHTTARRLVAALTAQEGICHTRQVSVIPVRYLSYPSGICHTCI
jgi:2-methylcitrate dehydratase PrpD